MRVTARPCARNGSRTVRGRARFCADAAGRRSLSTDERKLYIDAALCLQAKPPRLGSSVPGARSRFDDFVAVHINHTLIIHYTGTFLAWHRYFTWLYETALREECGYTGYQPYWEWSLDAADPTASPIFSGAADSLSGNGAYLAGRGPYNMGGGDLPDLFIPAGTGGDCVSSGPFRNMSVNLGPIDNPFLGVEATDRWAWNPRCLKRDLNPYVSSTFTSWSNVSDLLRQPDIDSFQMTMQGLPGSGSLGVHGGGHMTFGLDPGGDLFNSPGDPVFYLHHAQIDRMWWTWQHLDIENRRTAINGTGTFLNDPPSDPTTLDTRIDWGVLTNGSRAMKELMSTTDGPFCYTYA